MPCIKSIIASLFIHFATIIHSQSLHLNLPNDDLNELKSALHKASAIFDFVQTEEVKDRVPIKTSVWNPDDIIRSQYGTDMGICQFKGTGGCMQYQEDVAEYMQQSLSTPYVCFNSPILQMFLEHCLCPFCETMSIDEDVWTQWTQLYDSDNCETSNQRVQFKIGDDLCQWMGMESTKTKGSPISIDQNHEVIKEIPTDSPTSIDIQPDQEEPDMSTCTLNGKQECSNDKEMLQTHYLRGTQKSFEKKAGLKPEIVKRLADGATVNDEIDIDSMLVPIVCTFMMLVSAASFMATITWLPFRL